MVDVQKIKIHSLTTHSTTCTISSTTELRQDSGRSPRSSIIEIHQNPAHENDPKHAPPSQHSACKLLRAHSLENFLRRQDVVGTNSVVRRYPPPCFFHGQGFSRVLSNEDSGLYGVGRVGAPSFSAQMAQPDRQGFATAASLGFPKRASGTARASCMALEQWH